MPQGYRERARRPTAIDTKMPAAPGARECSRPVGSMLRPAHFRLRFLDRPAEPHPRIEAVQVATLYMASAFLAACAEAFTPYSSM